MRFSILLFYCLWILACTQKPLAHARGLASYSEIDPQKLINKLLAFKSDGCTKLFSEINYPYEDDWRLCCIRHDISYWKGGTKENRQEADQNLHSCIAERGHPDVADLVYYAVRAGGTDRYETSWKWGYGWVLSRGYSAHTAEESSQIEKEEAQIPKDLAKVIITDTPMMRPQMSLTGNRCIDAALTFLQRDMNKPISPVQAYYDTSTTQTGFEETIKITIKECALPFTFTYQLRKKSDCDAQQKISRSIKLSQFDIPSSCK